MNSALDLIDKYAAEIEADTQIDATNVMEKQFSAPNLKHKWLYRTVQEKRNLLRLVEAKEQLAEKYEKDNPLGLSKVKIKSIVDADADIKAINKKMREQELLVEYLDNNVNKIFSQLGYDFKNLVDLIKIEQLT